MGPLKKQYLTTKQYEIMELLVTEELTQKQVAKKLCLSLSAIRWHMSILCALYNSPNSAVLCIRYLKEKHKEELYRLNITQSS